MRKNAFKLHLFTVIATLSFCFTAYAELRISWHWQGGHSPYKYIKGNVIETGQVDITYLKYNSQPVEFKYHLNQDEIAALGALIQATNFFAQPSEVYTMVKDTGSMSITVESNGREHSVKYNHYKELLPLGNALFQLKTQAEIMHDLPKGDNIYKVLGAVNPNHASAKAFSPRLLIVPLKEYIVKCQNNAKLAYGLEALACLVSPWEWYGFIGGQLKTADTTRKLLIMSVLFSHPFFDNIPKECRQHIPVLLSQIIESYAQSPKAVPASIGNAFHNACIFFIRDNDACDAALNHLVKTHPEQNEWIKSHFKSRAASSTQ